MLIVAGGLVAVEMGLPARFVCAVNINDIVARTINNGDFSNGGDVKQSHASAMDIQVSENDNIWLLQQKEMIVGIFFCDLNYNFDNNHKE